MKKLIKPVKRKLEHPLLENSQVIEEGFELSDKAKELNLSCIAFDTASALGFQERNQIKIARHLDVLDLRGWSDYGDSLNMFIYNICSLPVKTIFNVHSDRDQDVGGEVIEYPALKGSRRMKCKNGSTWFSTLKSYKIQKPMSTHSAGYKTGRRKICKR